MSPQDGDVMAFDRAETEGSVIGSLKYFNTVVLSVAGGDEKSALELGRRLDTECRPQQSGGGCKNDPKGNQRGKEFMPHGSPCFTLNK